MDLNKNPSVLTLIKTLLIIVFCNVCFKSYGQVNITFGSGTSVGWWVQKSKFSQNNNVIADRSHFALAIPVNSSINYSFNDVNIGLVGTILFTNDDRIVLSEDKSFNDRTTQISNGWFSLSSFGIKFNYLFFSDSKISVAPEIQLGVFDIQTTHPNRQNFTNKIYYSAGVEITIKSQSHGLFITPNYTEYLMNDNTMGYTKHNIYFVGIDFGYKYFFK